MKLLLALISTRRGGLTGPAADLIEMYTERSARHTPTELRVFPTEAKFLASLDAASGRTRPRLLLADSRGQQLSSEELAATLTRAFDDGLQQLVFAIGGADGWSPTALARADQTLAFGRITLPHELAAVVAAEQLYRALTLRAGHPYHSGH
jgi:23S rRNA (pseudouridine1915-N3)-methyltransferase